MARSTDNFRNILVIDLGQMGDVVQSMPALAALRRRFPDASITGLIEKTPAQVVRLGGVFDEIIEVDRGELKRRPKPWSILQIFRMVGDIRRRKFDLVVDLHSLYETNILGFLSGARHRLFANRESRSLDFLGNFKPRPPVEDKELHISDRYLDVLRPLEIDSAETKLDIAIPELDTDSIDRLWKEKWLESARTVVGLFPGAGHPSRCWDLNSFASLSQRLLEIKATVIVFLGPEEAGMADSIMAIFPPEVVIIEKLSIAQFIAATSRLSVFITNDTGPLHLASLAGVPILALFDRQAPLTYKPRSEKVSIVNSATIDQITVDEVFDATSKLLERS